MNKGKTLIIAALCGLPADNKIVKAAMGDSQAGRDMLATGKIAKDDLFVTPEGDESFFAYPESFDNFAAIAAMLAEQGETLHAEDFTKPIGSHMSLIKYAERHKKVEALFSPEIWQGRYREMDHIFYSVSKTVRDSMNYTEMRRAVAAMTGDLVPEDRLRACDLEPMSVRLKIRHGNVDELQKELAKHNEPVRKDYIFLLDSAGDCVFEFADAFDNLHKWADVLAEQGEAFTKEDFLFRVGDRPTPLEHAIKHKRLEKIFTPQIWMKRAGEMMELYKELPEGERKNLNVLDVLTAIKESEYGDKVVTDDSVTLDSLTRVLNADEKGQEHFYPIHALGFARVWENMDSIRARLAERNESLTLDHLRQPAGLAGDTIMVLAARTGHFDQVMAIAADAGQTVSTEELTAPSSNGKSILDILIERDEAAAVFHPENWIGRGQEMVALWQKIPMDKRENIDFEGAYGRTTMLTLRRQYGNRPAGPAP